MSKQANSNLRASTLLFKKHKTTVMLSVQPHEPIPEVKKTLLEALKSRDIQAINGDKVPDQPEHIELGVLIDRSDPEKGWKRLVTPGSETNGENNAGRSGDSVLAAGLATGHWIAFKFCQPGEELNTGPNEETSWDVILPKFDEGEGEEDEEM